MDGLLTPSRVATSLAFVLAALCFLLPFVTAGCDERTTAQGIDFVTGHEPPVYDENGREVEADDDDNVAVKLIREGGPAATLALTFVLAGALFSVLPGATGAAACFLAGAFGLGGFLLFLLGLELRIEGVFADLRIGFWLAVLLTAGGTLAARRRWASLAPALPAPRTSARLAGAGALLMPLAVIVPHATSGRDESEDPTSIVYAFIWALSPGSREAAAWTAIALVGLTFFLALSALVLSRSPTLARPGATAAALGLAGMLLAVEAIAFFAAFDGIGVGDGLWIQLAGSALVLAGGLLAARNSGETQMRPPRPAVLLAIVGAVVVVVATLLPYDRGGEDIGSRALLELDLDADRWFVLAPLVLALATVLAVLQLGRETASGALVGLGAGLVIAFVSLLYPAFGESDDSIPASLGAGSFVGLAGAALVAAAGLLASRGRSGSRRCDDADPAATP